LAFTTADDVLFAYHKAGVLRLWDSPENDMELQARTLTPGGINCEATLIGQVALRAADQLITVVGSEDVFDIRFNGVQQNNLTLGQEVIMGSGPDQLLVQYSNNSLSITSKRGMVLDINLFPIEGMSWITVPHSLDPAKFYGNTQGLLGIYDGDATNDLTMRNGTQLPVLSLNDTNGAQTEFGNSWLMSESESLFGDAENAIADADAEYLGFDQDNIVDCPTDFSNYSVPECEAIDPQLRQVCYFDVIVGGPQFLDDIEYKPVCGNNSDQYCSFHGDCAEDNSMCICDEGWMGSNCGERDCPQACLDSPGGGECDPDTGLCSCQPRFTGATCEEAADCSSVGNCSEAIGGGVCVDNGLCECNFGYLEPNCTMPTPMPTRAPTALPTEMPTTAPPSPAPTLVPTAAPSSPAPTPAPPSPGPTTSPTPSPTTFIVASGDTPMPTTAVVVTTPTPAPTTADGGGAAATGGLAGDVPGWGIALSVILPLLCCCCIGFVAFKAYRKRQGNAYRGEKEVSFSTYM